jgi:hypothetical protein
MAVKSALTQLREFFAADGGRKLTMDELKEFKESNGGKDYAQVSGGIADGTLTY